MPNRMVHYYSILFHLDSVAFRKTVFRQYSAYRQYSSRRLQRLKEAQKIRNKSAVDNINIAGKILGIFPRDVIGMN